MKTILLTTFLAVFALSQSLGQSTSSPADSTKKEPIRLLKKGKFSIGSLAPLPIENHFIGLGYGYTAEFKTAFVANPYAARELRKSYQYQAMETGAKVIFYTLIVKSFIDSIKKAKAVSNGNFYGNSTPVVDSVNLTVIAGISFYGTIKKRKQIKKAVRVFNGELISK